MPLRHLPPLLMLSACSARTAGPPAAASAPETASEVERQLLRSATSLPEVTDGVCRAYELEAPPAPDGCRTLGPFPGSIEGAQLSGAEHSLEDALAACIEDPTCVGVTSEWYTGMPFSLVGGASARFEVNDDSYACSFVFACSPDP